MRNLHINNRGLWIGLALSCTVLIMVPLITGAAPAGGPPSPNLPDATFNSVTSGFGTTVPTSGGVFQGVTQGVNASSTTGHGVKGTSTAAGANYGVYGVGTTAGVAGASSNAAGNGGYFVDNTGVNYAKLGSAGSAVNAYYFGPGTGGAAVTYSGSGFGSGYTYEGQLGVAGTSANWASGWFQAKQAGVEKTSVKLGTMDEAVNAKGIIKNDKMTIAVNGDLTDADTGATGAVTVFDDQGLELKNNTGGIFLDVDGLTGAISNPSGGSVQVNDAQGFKITGSGSANEDFDVAGRIRTGSDGNHKGGIWLGKSGDDYQLFMGQIDSSRLGFWNNGSWRFAVDSWGHLYNPTEDMQIDDDVTILNSKNLAVSGNANITGNTSTNNLTVGGQITTTSITGPADPDEYGQTLTINLADTVADMYGVRSKQFPDPWWAFIAYNDGYDDGVVINGSLGADTGLYDLKVGDDIDAPNSKVKVYGTINSTGKITSNEGFGNYTYSDSGTVSVPGSSTAGVSIYCSAGKVYSCAYKGGSSLSVYTSYKSTFGSYCYIGARNNSGTAENLTGYAYCMDSAG